MNSNNYFISVKLIEDEISELKQKEQTEEVLTLLSYCERELELMKHISVNGVSMFNCSIDQFKNTLKEKPNVLILSNEELEDINKGLEMVKIFNKIRISCERGEGK